MNTKDCGFRGFQDPGMIYTTRQQEEMQKLKQVKAKEEAERQYDCEVALPTPIGQILEASLEGILALHSRLVVTRGRLSGSTPDCSNSLNKDSQQPSVLNLAHRISDALSMAHAEMQHIERIL